MLQPSNIRIPNNTTSNRKSQRRVPWLYLLIKEKRRRAGVWFDPFKKIHTTPSESPCFLSLRRETASNAAWCAACWHEDELKNCLHFFYNYHWTDNMVNRVHKAKTKQKERKKYYLKHRQSRNQRATNRSRATLNDTLQHWDRKLGQCQSSRVGGKHYCN